MQSAVEDSTIWRRKITDSVLQIKYYIYDIRDNCFESDSYEEASASFEEGKIVYEVHETTWNSPWTSGQHVVQFEWYHHNKGE